jgi:hypothetical protein
VPISIHPKVFHHVLESAPATGWQVREEVAGLTVLLSGLRETALCERIAGSIRASLEEQGALVGSITVRAVDALERGATGKAPLVMSKGRRKTGG